jgi:hypothetical protein
MNKREVIRAGGQGDRSVDSVHPISPWALLYRA